MSYPTLLGPWYVVQRVRSDGTVSGDYLPPEYYTSAEDEGRDLDDDPMWTRDEKHALLFMSLQSAARVADAEGAQVRVLYSKDHAAEFHRA